VNYIGDYDYYLEKKDELTAIYAPGEDASSKAPQISESKLSWQQKKEEQAEIRRRKSRLKKIEEQIENLETRDAEIDDLMQKPDICTDYEKCTALSVEKGEIASELEALYEEWESLASEVEE